MKILMWVPGLFWLFLVAVYKCETKQELKYFKSICIIHGVYSVLQIYFLSILIIEILKYV